MATKAILIPDYIVDEDASVTFDSSVIDMVHPFQSLSFQFVWDTGVVGVVTFYASIFPDPFNWEKLVNCDCIEFDTADSQTSSEIVSIPGVWLTSAFIKFQFVPATGSVGNMDVAQRIAPT